VKIINMEKRKERSRNIGYWIHLVGCNLSYFMNPIK
jgi:hypothetical protein